MTTHPLPPRVVARVALPGPPTPTPVAHEGDDAGAAKVSDGAMEITETKRMTRHAKKRSAIPALLFRTKGSTPDMAPPAFIYMNYRYCLNITAEMKGEIQRVDSGNSFKTLNLSKRVMNQYARSNWEWELVSNCQ
jgi:hypothetical protein